MNIRRTLAVSVTSLALAAVATTSFGQMPNFGGLMHNAASSDNGSANVVGAQSAFFRTFSDSRLEVGLAQLNLARAFELKDAVTELEAEQASLAGGPLDKAGIKKSTELSDSVNQQIAARMDSGAELSADGKRYYVAAIPHLLKGTLLAVQLPGEAATFANSAKAAVSSASLMDKARLAGTAMTAVAIAKDMPGFVSNLFGAYKKTLAYGQSKNIPIPKDATDALGSLQ
jgi:hypothetical protein